MGISLWVHRADGREEHLNAPSLENTLLLLNAIPWQDDIALAESLATEDSAPPYPELGLVDDASRSLRLVVHSDHLGEIVFSYPRQSSTFGFATMEEQAELYSNTFPRERIRELLSRFFAANYDAIYELIEAYPCTEEETK
jgi:hypothetical protein